MLITDIQIIPTNGESASNVLAYAAITFDDCFVVRGVRIIETPNKRFVAMPAKRIKAGAWLDIALPINQDMRDYIEREVLAKFDGVPA